MEGITIRQVTVTTKAARVILTTAFEAGVHGSRAWAVVNKEAREQTWIRRVELADNEDGGKTHVVTDAEIKNAIQAILQDPKGCGIESAKALGRIITGEWDGPLADDVVQVACFGKVIYG